MQLLLQRVFELITCKIKHEGRPDGRPDGHSDGRPDCCNGRLDGRSDGRPEVLCYKGGCGGVWGGPEL